MDMLDLEMLPAFLKFQRQHIPEELCVFWCATINASGKHCIHHAKLHKESILLLLHDYNISVDYNQIQLTMLAYGILYNKLCHCSLL